VAAVTTIQPATPATISKSSKIAIRTRIAAKT